MLKLKIEIREYRLYKLINMLKLDIKLLVLLLELIITKIKS